MKKQIVLHKFKNEDQEREFWASIDLNEYFEPSDFKRFVLTDLTKPRTRKVTIRLPEQWIARAKEKASKLDIPYQSLMKPYIQKGLEAR